MEAQIVDHYSKQRQILHSIVPINEPFSLNIEPATFCNLKCNFCIYSRPKNEISKEQQFFQYMSDETFDIIAQQLKIFQRPIKSVSFIGTGEPLLHKKLPEMICRLKSDNVAEQIIIVTNGTLLKKELSQALMSSGVDIIKISVNGLNANDYFENCGAKINFSEFIENLSYLYEHRGKCRVLIKTLTSVLGDRNDQLFYDLYGNLCDQISIERTMPYFSGVDYQNLISANVPSSRYRTLQKTVKVCAAPFIRMGIRVDGTVTLCGCRVGITTENMDIRKSDLYHIWNGVEHRQVLLNILKERFDGITQDCATCTSRNDFAFEEDNLDPYVDEVYQKIVGWDI